MLPQNSNKHVAESARYALLRRLAPSLRHDMAGALQPLMFVSAILEKRLQNPNPDVADLARKSSELTTLARVASSTCMNLLAWLEPNKDELVTVSAGVEEVIGLVRTELSFKGITIVNETGDVHAELLRSQTRNVLTAAMLTLTDAATAPGKLVLAAQLVEREIMLTILFQRAESEMPTSGIGCYRNLDWADLQVLAEVESVRLTYTADRVNLYLTLIET